MKLISDKAVIANRMKLYKQGKTDVEIALAEGCSAATIGNWRKRNYLKSNFDHKANRKKAKIEVDKKQHKQKSPEYLFKPAFEEVACTRTNDDCFANPLLVVEFGKVLVDRLDEY